MADDPLSLLRTAIEAFHLPILTSTADATTLTDVAPFDTATHLQFNTSDPSGPQHIAFNVSQPTCFHSQAAEAAVDLASIYFCWLNKDSTTAEYISATHALNEARAKNSLGSVTNLVFAEKFDLVAWLSGDAKDSEYIRRPETKNEASQAAHAADLASGEGDVPMTGTGRLDHERVAEIVRAERSTGDRNTVLQGQKHTDFAHIRKITETFLRKSSSRPSGPVPVPSATSRPNRPGGRRPEPIILLSPSASSLLRLSNIQSFLVDGTYAPTSSAQSTGANMLYITRTLNSIDPSRPQRFILVESPDNFKPEYWNRVVAVLTTGQAWQFKNYKWQQPAELFSHALGIYIGWRGDSVPETVKSWGRGVIKVSVDPVREAQQTVPQPRWRDREVVEEIWSEIEASMRKKGWRKDGIA